MPRVNLVPKDEQAREFRRQFLIIPVAGVALLFIGMIGGYIYFDQQLQSSNEELQQYQDNNESQKRQVQELEEYEAIGREKQDKLAQVTLLDLQRMRWSRTLDDLAFVVPDDIWFVEIEGSVPWEISNVEADAAQDEDSEYDFTVEGYTRVMSSVAVFMIRMGLIPSLERVELITAEQEETEGQLAIKFKIGASLVPLTNVSQPAIAPSTGEDGPSDGTSTTDTSTTETSTTETGTGTTSTTSTGSTGTTGTSTGN
jgi:Tfp pilus assembly protein PilN